MKQSHRIKHSHIEFIILWQNLIEPYGKFDALNDMVSVFEVEVNNQIGDIPDKVLNGSEGSIYTIFQKELGILTVLNISFSITQAYQKTI